MTKASTDIQVRLVRWSERHAIVMLAGTALILTGASLWALMLLAAASFAALVWRCRTHWTLAGRFGAANAVTSLRLLGVLALPAFAAMNPLAVAGFAVTVFALDGVDGWLARRLGLASEFGEYLDKETDAFFMLVLCVLVYAGGRFGAWILVPGLLRYGFVVFLMLAKPPRGQGAAKRQGCVDVLRHDIGPARRVHAFPHFLPALRAADDAGAALFLRGLAARSVPPAARGRERVNCRA